MSGNSTAKAWVLAWGCDPGAARNAACAKCWIVARFVWRFGHEAGRIAFAAGGFLLSPIGSGEWWATDVPAHAVILPILGWILRLVLAVSGFFPWSRAPVAAAKPRRDFARSVWRGDGNGG